MRQCTSYFLDRSTAVDLMPYLVCRRTGPFNNIPSTHASLFLQREGNKYVNVLQQNLFRISIFVIFLVFLLEHGVKYGTFTGVWKVERPL